MTQAREQQKKGRRGGFTSIEVLVVLSITGILVALFLPAVQAARESARRIACQNNLHQIGLAIHSYDQSQNSYPPALISVGYGPGLANEYTGFFSVHCRLLPYLDMRPLYNAINFDVGTWPPDTYAADPGQRAAVNSLNVTVYRTNIAMFLCPSDGGSLGETGNNYRGNVGVGPSFSPWVETPDSGNGIFPEGSTVNASQITDGLSHTIAFSERVRGSGKTPIDPERDVFKRLGVANTADQILLACRAAARPPANDGFVYSGRYWFWTGRERTLYNQAQGPNGTIPDCTYGGMTPAIDLATARSHHPGGVNALMADGSQRFVSDSIDQSIWRGLGTRNGGEPVE